MSNTTTQNGKNFDKKLMVLILVGALTLFNTIALNQGWITPQQNLILNAQTESMIQQLMPDLNLTYDQVVKGLTLEVGSSLSGLAGPYSYMIAHPLGDTSITAMKNGTTGAWDYWSSNTSSVFSNAIGNETNGGVTFVAKGSYVDPNILFNQGHSGGNKEWVLEGNGYQTDFWNTIAGTSAITVRNSTTVVLKDFSTYSNDATSEYGILGDNLGVDEQSFYEGSVIDNVWVQGVVELTNYMGLSVGSLNVKCGQSGVIPLRLLENTSHLINYGNSNFKWLNVYSYAATAILLNTTDGISYGPILNLDTFQYIGCSQEGSTSGTVGVFLDHNVAYEKFNFIDVEGFGTALEVSNGGAYDWSSYGNVFSGGYLRGVAYGIYCPEHSYGNVFTGFGYVNGGTDAIYDCSKSKYNNYANIYRDDADDLTGAIYVENTGTVGPQFYGVRFEATDSVSSAVNGGSFLYYDTASSILGAPNAQITLTPSIAQEVANPTSVNATGLQYSLYWTNGTAVDANHSPCTLYWYVHYNP
jgi:hypothetical protein